MDVIKVAGLTALLVLVNSGTALAKAMRIDLPTKVVACDLIAQVKVSSTRENPLEGKTNRGMRSVAQCRVLQPVKGLQKGAQFELEFDNGFLCPNVLYRTGDDCIIFARLLPNGRYSTYNTYFGKFTVKDGAVLGWRGHGEKSGPPKRDEVFAEIRSLTEITEDWSQPVNGLSVLLRPTQPSYVLGENIDIVFIFKNTSRTPIVIPYRVYPFKTHTYWSLDIKRPDNQVIKPTPHPHLTKDSIEDYFSKRAREYNMEIAPGAIRSYYLPRINTAEPGWGYKERLKFSYYVMNRPGTYTVSAEAHNVLPGNVLRTKPIRIVIHEKDSQKGRPQPVIERPRSTP